jgi:copper transport protein
VLPRLAFALALLTALLCSPKASAHASLVKAEPADGAVLLRAPAALVLTFNEPISPLVMRLVGPDGAPIALGKIDAENATITIAAPSALAAGSYVLSWRVVSADGHPVGGAVLFSIGAPSAKLDIGDADARVRALLWFAKLVLYVGLFVGIGGAFFRAWIADRSARATKPTVAALLVGLAASVMAIGLQGLDALALPLAGLRDPLAWQTGAATAFGPTVLVAALALISGAGSIAARSRGLACGLSLAALLGAGLALALSGHASTAAPQLVNRTAVFVHGICVAFWIGALLPLYAGLRGSPDAGRVLARFSRAIPIPLLLLIASGSWLAVVQLGRVDALWTTTSYGEVLACKLVVVAVLLGLAAVNRYRLVPKFEHSSRPLALSLAFELAVALLILGLVALWRFTPPPRTLATDAPISLHLHGDKAMAQIEIAWDAPQRAHADVLVLDGSFQPLTVKEVTLVFANPAAGIEPIRRTAAAAADGWWRIDELKVPLAGRWNLRVELLVSDFDKLTVEDAVTLPRVP